MNNTPATETVISDALLVAGVTAWSYALGFAYRSSFVEYFGLPNYLATPSISAVLIAVAALAGTLLSYFAIANLIWTLAPHNNSAIAGAVRRVVALSLVMGLMMFPVLKERAIWVFVLVIVGVYAAFEFLFPLITQRGSSTYEAKLDAQNRLEIDVQSRGFGGLLHRTVGAGWVRVGLFAVLTIFLANMLGRTHAREQETFFVLEDAPDSVVVVMDGDVLVAANIDRSTKALKGSFSVRKLSDGKPWNLRHEKFGRLQPPPTTK